MSKATLIILALLMTTVTLIATPIQVVQAQRQAGQQLPPGVTPAFQTDTRAYLSFRPNPVGVGQTFLVNMWTTPALHRSRQQSDYTVTITKPDGTKDVVKMNSYHADATAWFEYLADQVGEWKLKFEFPGGYFPAANLTGGFNEPAQVSLGEVYYKPSSTAEKTLTVQQDPVLSWPPAPLPTDYWTRPVRPEQREWVSILGDYPWYGPAGGAGWPAETNTYWSAQQRFTPYVQAPNTAHILWKRQDAIAGIIGGTMTNPVDYLRGRGSTPSIILQGRCYQTVTRVSQTGTGTQSYWQCYNLRTGELFWERPLYAGESAPSIVEYDTGTLEVPGAEARAGSTVYLVSITSPTSTISGRLLKYDPLTGAVSRNLTGPPPGVTSGTYYMNQHVFSIQTIGSGASATRRLINWTTMDTPVEAYGVGTTVPDDFSLRVRNNITWPLTSLPASTDFNTGITVLQTAISPPQMGAWQGINLVGVSLKTGAMLWNITESFPISQFSGSCTVADHGKVAVCTVNGFWVCYDLNSGKKLWESEKTADPWGIWWAYSVSSAYGMIYGVTYAGVYAIDWDTGKIVWHYKNPTPYAYETPYTDETGQSSYSFRSAILVADGKLYTGNTEHTPTAPITRGWSLHCINAMTGEGIWKILGEMNAGPMSDGYITASSYDGYMYVFGKGRSITTVTTPDIVVAKGEGIVIKGTVLDMSPAQPGTPCVSKESMETQMEYLNMQMPIAGVSGNETITGVPVSLTALGADGSSIDIGTVTTDGYYGTFSKAWTPPTEGDYKVIASFAGDESYGSSAASTAITVGPAQTSTNTEQQQVTVPDYTMTIIVGIIAVIIAVAIATIILYRKK